MLWNDVTGSTFQLAMLWSDGAANTFQFAMLWSNFTIKCFIYLCCAVILVHTLKLNKCILSNVLKVKRLNVFRVVCKSATFSLKT